MKWDPKQEAMKWDRKQKTMNHKLLRTVSVKQNEIQLKQYGKEDRKLLNWTQNRKL